MDGHGAPGRLRGSLVLVRHAQTPCTLAGRFCGAHDPALSAAGRQMAGHMARHPALADAGAVVSSPARRALATAAVVAAARGTRVGVDARLRELSFGEWEDRRPADLDGDPALLRWEQDPALWAPPGGETGLQVMARAVAAVRDALAPAGVVAVMTHKATIRLVLSFFLGLPPSRYRWLGPVPVGSVSRLRLGRGAVTLEALGDVSHLPPAWRADPDRCAPEVSAR